MSPEVRISESGVADASVVVNHGRKALVQSAFRRDAELITALMKKGLRLDGIGAFIKAPELITALMKKGLRRSRQASWSPNSRADHCPDEEGIATKHISTNT